MPQQKKLEDIKKSSENFIIIKYKNQNKKFSDSSQQNERNRERRNHNSSILNNVNSPVTILKIEFIILKLPKKKIA